MSRRAQIYFAVFGVLTIAGGIVGYVTAGSRASIIAGSLTGVLLLLAALFPRAGLCALSLLTILAGYRQTVSGALIGGGLLLVGAFLLPRRAVAIAIALFISSVLAIQFVPKFLRTGTIMPAGIMSMLSMIGVIVALVEIIVPLIASVRK